MRSFLPALLMAAVLALGPEAVWGQDAELVLNPPLSEAFPLDVRPDGVRVAYPVLINDHTVVRPNAVLRFIFINTTAGLRGPGAGREGGPGGLTHSRQGPHGSLSQDDTGGAAGAWGSNGGDPNAGMFDYMLKNEEKQGKTELQTEVWKQKDLFVDALDHALEMGTTLVYSVPPQVKPATAMLDLPVGVLLGEVEGHVRVLSTTTTSKALRSGIRPGDEILSLSGDGPIGTLDDFVREFQETKRQTQLSGNPTYVVQISRAGQTMAIQMEAPPTIPSFF